MTINLKLKKAAVATRCVSVFTASVNIMAVVPVVSGTTMAAVVSKRSTVPAGKLKMVVPAETNDRHEQLDCKEPYSRRFVLLDAREAFLLNYGQKIWHPVAPDGIDIDVRCLIRPMPRQIAALKLLPAFIERSTIETKEVVIAPTVH